MSIAIRMRNPPFVLQGRVSRLKKEPNIKPNILVHPVGDRLECVYNLVVEDQHQHDKSSDDCDDEKFLCESCLTSSAASCFLSHSLQSPLLMALNREFPFPSSASAACSLGVGLGVLVRDCLLMPGGAWSPMASHAYCVGG
jgi:hypothetical protein